MAVHDIHRTELLLLLLVSFTALLGAAAQRFKVPYPILMVIGGLALSLIPIFPDITLSPTLVFLVVLPPLLYSAALGTSWREFRHNLFPILLLAFGAVGFTVVGVAFAAHLALPDFDLATGAVLGAVVCATDAIAASAIGRRVGLPQELLDLIEGESLVNDAAGLLALQFSVALVASRTLPTVAGGAGELALLVGAGISAGLAVGAVISTFQRPVQGSALQTLVSLAAPYFSYLLGETLHGSGVLATVACGLYVGRKSSLSLTSEARLQTGAVWNTIEFGLNGIVFILIGLQLPVVLDGMRPLHWPSLIAGAAFISVLVLALRLVWIYLAGFATRLVRSRVLGEKLKPRDQRRTFVIGWAGMRGVLTLAAALSLPDTTDAGAPFPHRSGILFLAFAAILVSLTGQGLTLPWIIRRFHLTESAHLQHEERKARWQLTTAALQMLERERDGDRDQVVTELIGRFYRQRLDALKDGDRGKTPIGHRQQELDDLSAKLRLVEREELAKLETEGAIGGETHRKLERELDLLDLRFPSG